MTENDRSYKTLSGERIPILANLPPQPQDYPGLDAAGFLLVALGHLVKAKEKLDQEPRSKAVYDATRDTVWATVSVRDALRVLDELKEETCEKLQSY